MAFKLAALKDGAGAKHHDTPLFPKAINPVHLSGWYRRLLAASDSSDDAADALSGIIDDRTVADDL